MVRVIFLMKQLLIYLPFGVPEGVTFSSCFVEGWLILSHLFHKTEPFKARGAQIAIAISEISLKWMGECDSPEEYDQKNVQRGIKNAIKRCMRDVSKGPKATPKRKTSAVPMTPTIRFASFRLDVTLSQYNSNILRLSKGWTISKRWNIAISSKKCIQVNISMQKYIFLLRSQLWCHLDMTPEAPCWHRMSHSLTGVQVSLDLFPGRQQGLLAQTLFWKSLLFCKFNR